MKYISIGGWCGTTMSLRGNGMYDEAYPFDHIRSTFKGIIDCIENDFSNFFPKKLEVDIIKKYPYNGKSYRGKYFGFYHHKLTEPNVICDFNRRIERFHTFLRETTDRICFVRTISSHHWTDETEQTDAFNRAVKNKFPSLEFLLLFVIPGQDKTQFYRKLNTNTFIFTLDDKSENNNNLPREYRPIYDFLKANDLFKEAPDDNIIEIKLNNRFVEVHGVPITRDDN